ncbi:MAG: tRNA uridine-5-carboxymethylaminomethyl(34) synthesis enzyme MnmG [Bacteroidia bacterium]|nr:tRNA uridine-5-carboxymethylaminomethyl(34) synthesis enzyme MnmG [Bacteroidia bacterium]
MFQKYDVIVVGAGHAGCEAAAAAANMGSKVMLVTMNMGTIAQMSCNPAMGGIAKGQIVREIDALGGYSGIVSDLSAVQFKMLNRSKGPAMWSPRTQNDRMLFSAEWRSMLEKTEGVDFFQDMVKEIIVEGNRVIGVKTSIDVCIYAKSVVLTNGTFLNGIIHIGEKQMGGGRAGEKAAKGITEQLVSLGFRSGRMKTGTPPRIDGRSLDYSKMEVQPGDEHPGSFSFSKTPKLSKQLNCWMTYTNDEVHDMLRTGFDRSPMFNGRIQGLGPRYCPSIEDKINRFADKDKHQLFVEPEGWNTVEIYVNGFSTSLPEDVQYEALRKVPGFENVKMFRPGYAIEYDFFPPEQLLPSLETKGISNLYFAGQINGTTGYEEAAGQGLIAGINAHRAANSLAPFILKRSEAYIGVLIDDLVNKGTDEPYRMFTSRAEFRIMLRQDNADQRLTPLAYEMGLVKEERYAATIAKYQRIAGLNKFIHANNVEPDEVNVYLEQEDSALISQKQRISRIVSRPGVELKSLLKHSKALSEYAIEHGIFEEELELADILLKYDGYIKREEEMAEKLGRLEHIHLHADFDYHALESLSSEAKEKLCKIKPLSIGQASRISGVSPTDIQVLVIHLGR